MKRPGAFYGIGLGPGDPELLTIKAARVLRGVDIVVCRPSYEDARRPNDVYRIAEPYLRAGIRPRIFDHLSNHPGSARAKVFLAQAAELVKCLKAGKRVAFVLAGDPLVYSPFIALAVKVRELLPSAVIRVVPGVSSMQAAAAAASVPLVGRARIGGPPDRLLVVHAPESLGDLKSILREHDTIVLFHVGIVFRAVVAALREAGRLGDAVLVEKASRPGATVTPARELGREVRAPRHGLMIVSRHRPAFRS
ncbi:MAG: precorrin-2 C(20)-methyltransferase [Elusimicrobia bacterium]|nr:precorrin-2 C(20)-methyltransferase [Elusimicrobiota bacterium]